MNNDPKAIFSAYAGMHFFMAQDGVYLDYKRFQVSPSQEAEWALELGGESLKKFIESRIVDSEFHKLMYLIKGYNLTSILKSLTLAISQLEAELDGFTKLLACENILDALSDLKKKFGVTTEAVNEIINVTRYIVDSLSRNKFTVSDVYMQGIQIPGGFDQISIQKRIVTLSNHFGLYY